MENNNAILFEESINVGDSGKISPLTGEISIYRKNKKSGEMVLHEKSKNVISISGYQWILMKMFGLYLDSNHGPGSDPGDISKDSTIVIPDLNIDDQYNIGISPDAYSSMNENISSSHFIQGFMIGNGGSAEDSITAKNTNYSFSRLRNAIPFREATQASPLDPTVAGQYLGVYRMPASNNNSTQAYYIKKFDDTPHIYHSWWRAGQKWDYVDPVTPSDLGPNAQSGGNKTDRIETYAECHLSLNEDDCIAYFNHDGNTGTAVVNELGLVAFDTVPGVLTTVQKLYDTHIKKIIKVIFDNDSTDDDKMQAVSLASEAVYILSTILGEVVQTNIAELIAVLVSMSNVVDPSLFDTATYRTELEKDTNIEVEALYNANGVFVYEENKYLEYVAEAAFAITSSDVKITDEAQRIKLVTYYTFNSIPIESDWEIVIYYRIYAN